MQSVGAWWLWLGFFVFVAVMLVIDMVCLGGKRSHKVSTKEALSWSIVWFILAIVFNIGLWLYMKTTLGAAIAHQHAIEFFTGYLIEKSLAMDNVFVFYMIFTYFHVPQEYQRRVLLYGVIGAIVLRFIMIYAGIALIQQFSWMFYIFGLILVITSIKMLIFAEKKSDIETNPLLKWMRGHLRITKNFHKEHFFLKQNNLWYVTPLFLVLVLIEFSDLVFAIDSIPAIFAITQDPFIVFTSNIFAILGLRAMYFLLAHMAEKFHLLKYGLGIILLFIGIKMLIMDLVKIPVGYTLSFVIFTLFVSIAASLLSRPKLN